MVTNQRQLFSVVSDWGSYLGSYFPTVFFVGSCLCVVASEHSIASRVVCSLLFFVRFTYNKNVEPISECSYDDRDKSRKVVKTVDKRFDS